MGTTHYTPFPHFLCCTHASGSGCSTRQKQELTACNVSKAVPCLSLTQMICLKMYAEPNLQNWRAFSAIWTPLIRPLLVRSMMAESFGATQYPIRIAIKGGPKLRKSLQHKQERPHP